MIRTHAKNLYYRSLSTIGADKRRMRELVSGDKVTVLNLHRVSHEMNPYWPPLLPEVFEQLLASLDKDFEVRTFDELEHPPQGRPIAVLSFDDGYYDFIEYTLPLLKKFGMRANMNVIPQCAISGVPIWNVRLYDFLTAAPRDLIDKVSIPGFETRLAGEDVRAKLEYGIAVSKFLKSRPREERTKLWEAVDGSLSSFEHPATRMMSVEELRSISDETELGVHSFDHESMGYEDQTFFADDLEKCKEFFADQMKRPVNIYAFPNGSYRPEQIDYLRQNGIEKVLLVDEAFAERESSVLTRFTVFGENGAEITLRSLGF
jgi:peptidoglycan/xylan/chitin deacetylase (PgdA/CDA1 family)